MVEAIIPFVRGELAAHRNVTEEFHRESVAARKETNEKIDKLAEVIAARENQAKGAAWVANLFMVGLGMVGGGLMYLVAKVLRS